VFYKRGNKMFNIFKKSSKVTKVIKEKANKKKISSFLNWILQAFKRSPKEAGKKISDESKETINEMK